MISSFAIHDWFAIIIILLIAIIVYLHFFYTERFIKFISITKINEYFIDYNHGKASFISVFNVLLFVFQLGVFALLLVFYSKNYNFSNVSFISFVSLLSVLLSFLLLRYLVGKIIAFIFELEKVQAILTFVKFTYYTKVSIYMLPFIIIFIYIPKYNDVLLRVGVFLAAIMLFVFYIILLLQNQKLILRNLFYFILYLCALEIIPLVYLHKVVSFLG